MVIVDIIVSIILIFSFIGGLKNGAVKEFFGLTGILIAIPVTGAAYGIMVAVLSFIPDTNWQNFAGFLITFTLVNIALFLLFLLPRMALGGIWQGGILSALIGGIFNVINAAIGLTVFCFLVLTYPVLSFLVTIITCSSMLNWLMTILHFVQLLLPTAFQQALSVY
ncbi:MAG TPA: hypothetical protein DCX22_01245 [Dehalococcoidia bacterium]|nr:hypothetical protein [Dehalococcoidia bacterium]